MKSRLKKLEKTYIQKVSDESVDKMAEYLKYLEKKYLHDITPSTDEEIMNTFPQLARFLTWRVGLKN